MTGSWGNRWQARRLNSLKEITGHFSPRRLLLVQPLPREQTGAPALDACVHAHAHVHVHVYVHVYVCTCAHVHVGTLNNLLVPATPTYFAAKQRK